MQTKGTAQIENDPDWSARRVGRVDMPIGWRISVAGIVLCPDCIAWEAKSPVPGGLKF